jgi:hypothetical protein
MAFPLSFNCSTANGSSLATPPLPVEPFPPPLARRRSGGRKPASPFPNAPAKPASANDSLSGRMPPPIVSASGTLEAEPLRSAGMVTPQREGKTLSACLQLAPPATQQVQCRSHRGTLRPTAGLERHVSAVLREAQSVGMPYRSLERCISRYDKRRMRERIDHRSNYILYSARRVRRRADAIAAVLVT